MLEITPETRVHEALGEFGDALADRNVERAVALFHDDCYWRDLVLFTWNIKTLEGKDAIRCMLAAQLTSTHPTALTVDSAAAPSDDGQVTSGWFTLETEVARGYGHIRLKDGKIWTLLTTMSELKGHEEGLGSQRPLGAKHGTGKHRPSWKEERDAEARTLGFATQPEVVIIGGGQGGIALGARLQHARRADHHRRAQRARRR